MRSKRVPVDAEKHMRRICAMTTPRSVHPTRALPYTRTNGATTAQGLPHREPPTPEQAEQQQPRGCPTASPPPHLNRRSNSSPGVAPPRVH
eukprot:362038-Chlamydomonas_euryale.AAC.6